MNYRKTAVLQYDGGFDTSEEVINAITSKLAFYGVDMQGQYQIDEIQINNVLVKETPVFIINFIFSENSEYITEMEAVCQKIVSLMNIVAGPFTVLAIN